MAKKVDNNGIVSLEQAISIFGPEVGAEVWAEVSQNSGGGTSAPFDRIQKISTRRSELGEFGEFVVGTKYDVDEATKAKTVSDPGTHLGLGFQFIVVNTKYQYTHWSDNTQKMSFSNMFPSLGGCATAVDRHGKSLGSKAEKREKEWKLSRVTTGLVRKDAKEKWLPATFSTSGTLLYGFNEVLGTMPNNGLLSGIVNLQFDMAASGSTEYTVVDVEGSSFEPLPRDLFTNSATKDVLADITLKMGEYQEQLNAKIETSEANPKASADADESEASGGDDW